MVRPLDPRTPDESRRAVFAARWLGALAPLVVTGIALVVFFTVDRMVGVLLVLSALLLAYGGRSGARRRGR